MKEYVFVYRRDDNGEEGTVTLTAPCKFSAWELFDAWLAEQGFTAKAADVIKVII